jgi:hypothetical protein
VKEVADEINEARREAEALARIYELTTQIDGFPKDDWVPLFFI